MAISNLRAASIFVGSLGLVKGNEKEATHFEGLRKGRTHVCAVNVWAEVGHRFEDRVQAWVQPLAGDVS